LADEPSAGALQRVLKVVLGVHELLLDLPRGLKESAGSSTGICAFLKLNGKLLRVLRKGFGACA
jgi:hypothetical protein